jgi:hypothetical protein
VAVVVAAAETAAAGEEALEVIAIVEEVSVVILRSLRRRELRPAACRRHRPRRSSQPRWRIFSKMENILSMPALQTQLSTKMENILHNPTLTARARLPWLPASRNGQRPRRAGTIDAATTTTTASS